MSAGKVVEVPLQAEFRSLVADWKSAEGVSSSLTERFSHPAYGQIILMGEAVLPYLLAELERDPDWWFAALKAITGADPVPASSRGRLSEMTHAWLAWADANGIQRA